MKPEDTREKMFVGTLTFHEAGSYGAVFQSYALQQALISLGVQTEIINYRCPAVWQYRATVRNPKRILGRMLCFPWRNKKLKKFDLFRKNVLRCSKPVTDAEGLRSLCDSYDEVIVGSDQIWNPDLTGGDYTYFLDFLQDNDKKVSYAASIGVDHWEKDDARLAELVRSFRYTSVREKSASEYLDKLAGIKADVVCDPTFLIRPDQWMSIVKQNNDSREYILIYMLGKNYQDCLKWCKEKLNRDGKYEIILVHATRVKGKGCKNVRDAGPEELLGLIRNARFVATNSFHGTCLSMIFQKDFVWFREGAEATSLKQRESRLKDLLAETGLAEREVNLQSEVPAPIDHDRLEAVISRFRSEGLAWLENALQKDQHGM